MQRTSAIFVLALLCTVSACDREIKLEPPRSASAVQLAVPNVTPVQFVTPAAEQQPERLATLREWRSSSGKHAIQAAMIRYVDGVVSLRKADRSIVVVETPRLSAEDQAYLEKRQTQFLFGRVVGITDGDTITVLDVARKQHRIRLEGIDAPESNQDFGTRSREALSGRVFQKQVRVEWHERDKYGRILGHIYLDDRWFNKEMVEEGWAWHYRKYSADPDLAHSEADARSRGVGLWAHVDAIAPWEFRSQPAATTPKIDQPPRLAPAPSRIAPVPRIVESPPTTESRISSTVTVYITKTGGKYHRAGCQYTRKSSIPISLDQAKQRYSPCSRCHPPS